MPAAATLRRLAPLTAVVLAVHVLLLQPEGDRIVPTPPVPFLTRTIAAPLPAPRTVVEPPAVTPPAPAPAPAAIAPKPRPRPAMAQAPAAAPPPPTAGPVFAAPATEPAAEPAVRPAAAAAPEFAVAILPSARLHYELQAQVRAFSLGGRAELTWRHDGQAYEARLEASALGRPSRVQRSVGRVTPQGLAPDYFSDRSRSEQATHFDRDRNRLVFSNNKPEAALAEGMQDRLSVVLQLAALVAGNPGRHAAGTTITIPTAGTGDAENWIFSVEGEEDLRLPGGAVRALKLQRLPRKEYDQKVELWLAPGMDYAPVRLRLTNPNGDAVDQRWSSTDRG
ncbi:DUF3108 domain-containing protein [Ramlibacter sp. PS3R-8]|uniref:DUF3108 domain-containing protein n=1 Tax=Ramlibacter sp. PS3R-8 TaxID=3133437 RepID=UPI0030A1C25E